MGKGLTLLVTTRILHIELFIRVSIRVVLQGLRLEFRSNSVQSLDKIFELVI